MAVDGLRSSRFVVAVLLILVLVGQVPWAMPVAAGQAAATLERAANEAPLDRPLDLAWAALTPADLDEPGYGALRSGYKELSAIYGRLGDPGPGSGGVSRVGASWRQTYEGWLALPSDDDPDDYARVIHTIVTRYRSDEGARAGLTATSAGYQERGYAASATAPAIGQDATALRGTGTDTRDGRVFDGLVVAFRAGPVVAEVEIRDFTRDAPAVSEATRLAGVVQRRLAEVAAGQMSDLSLAVPRARDAGTSVSNDRYVRRHGVVLQSFDQPASSVASVDAFDRRRGVVDRYAYFADWSDPAEAGAAPVGYYVTVFGFGGDAAAAERFLAAEPEDWRGRIDDAYRDVGPVEGWPGVGDEAAVVAYAVQRPSGVIARGFQGWVRVGARVTWVTSSSGAGLPRLAIDTMLRRAAACLKQPCGRTIAMADVLGLEAVSTIPDIAVAEPGDPAWAAVVPSDLTVPGYGFTGMGLRGAAAYAEAIASGEAAGALTRDLEAAGWRLGYTSGVARPNEDDPDLFDRTVRTTVSYYDSEAGASAALARLRVALEEGGHEPAASSPKVGDEAAILRKRVRAANTGNTGEVLRLLARTDAAVLDIAIVDWRDDAPATSEAVGLAEVLVARLVDAQEGGSPALTERVARLAGPGFEERWEGYGRRSGAPEPAYRQSAASIRALETATRNAGILDLYEYRVRWSDPERDDVEPVAFGVDVMRFSSVLEARSYVATVPGQHATTPPPGVRGITFEDEVGAFGEQSVVIRFTQDSAGSRSYPGYLAWIRTGDLVARVELVGPGASLPAFESVLGRQGDCLRTATCVEPMVSEEFGDDGTAEDRRGVPNPRAL